MANFLIRKKLCMIKINKYLNLIILFNILYNINISFANEAWDKARLAMPCAGCHGLKEPSSIPSLCNLEEKYIYNSLLEYKEKKRENYLMQIIANGYTENEIRSLSVYFSKTFSEKVCK